MAQDMVGKEANIREVASLLGNFVASFEAVLYIDYAIVI